jgi:hypothetical protein
VNEFNLSSVGENSHVLPPLDIVVVDINYFEKQEVLHKS